CHTLLARNPSPTEDDVRRAVSGNTCRCGTYPKVFEAALAAAQTAPVKAGAPQGVLPQPGGAAAPPEAAKAEAKAQGTNERSVSVGLPGALAKKQRKTEPGEPQPWDGSAQLRVVGQPTPRIDGPEKVTGRARYSFDVQLPDMLYAAVARSPHAHARIK